MANPYGVSTDVYIINTCNQALEVSLEWQLLYILITDSICMNISIFWLV